MVKRPVHIWLAFGTCLIIVLAVMVWLSMAILRLDVAQKRATAREKIEQNVRLALWRMDSALTPLIAEESARPYFTYQPLYAAERPYGRKLGDTQPHETLVPSPMLLIETPEILLHFQVDPAGTLSSPQVPTGHFREVALANYMTQEHLDCSAQLLTNLQSILTPQQVPVNCSSEPTLAATQFDTFQQLMESDEQDVDSVERGTIERQARQYYTTKAARQQAVTNSQIWDNSAFADSLSISSGLAQPLWINSELILARTVTVEGQCYIQGTWLNWPVIQGELLNEIHDLLPKAKLAPVTDSTIAVPDRLLAALPIQLIPGVTAQADSAALSPLRFSLILAWVCVLLAAVAVVALVRGTLALSERRAAFVGAVTHELRTPLTTFQMYTEMLDENMVSDPERRKSYMQKLRSESKRLNHLVENVLSYSRLEGGGAATALSTACIGELLNRMRERLGDRAEQASMTMAVEMNNSEHLQVCADPSAVEQILFNLVDNACKYARGASNNAIHLQVGKNGKAATIRVRDHGPGIASTEAGRLFRPFHKSDRDAANSAPGVGLGLALSRRLARDMGGDLRLDTENTHGACFILMLPMN